MEKFSGSLIRQFPSTTTGNAASSVQVTVKLAGTNTLATLYATNNIAGAQLGNPLTTDGKGFYSFYAQDGKYTLEFNNGYPSLDINLIDANDLVGEFNSAILNTGYVLLDNGFTAGYTITQRNEVLLFSGEWYRWDGALPKAVPAASSPSTTGGISSGAWVSVGDAALRNDLAATDSTVPVGGVNAGTLPFYVDDVATLQSMSLIAGRTYITKEFNSGTGRGGATYIAYPAGAAVRSFIDHAGANGVVAVFQPSNNTITASQMGFNGESLFSDTQNYKGVDYPVQRWTLNQDFLPALESFLDSDIATLDIEDLFLYVSFVAVKAWLGKRITGSGRFSCGFIKGSLNWADGTKGARVDNIGFYGLIGYTPLPLPATNVPAEAADPDKFYVLDDLSFGYGFGALGASTASSNGNSSNILVENCHFEMRDAVISGGSAPDNEDRPKVQNITFRNNTTRNIMFHGFASIHFQYAKVYGNHFEEHYNGYACDFSLGTVDSEFYNNTGIKLAAGVKAESRDFNGNFRNKFYDNDLTVDGGFGAAFNLLFRNSGQQTECYNNTFRLKDYNPVASGKVAFNVEGLSTDIYNNNIYITGAPLNFDWVCQVKNKLSIGVAGQALYYRGNKLYNQTVIKIKAGLQVTTTNSTNTFSIIDHSGNNYYGSWESMVKPEFATVTDVISELIIRENTFPNTALFRPTSAFTINNIIIDDNKCVPLEAGNVATLAFITCNGKIRLTENDVRSAEGGSSIVSFASATNAIGSLANADILVSRNTIDDFSGALLFLSSGGTPLAAGNIVITGNDVTLRGSFTYAGFVNAGGATRFAMGANTLINESANAGTIVRPADGANSKYLNNITIGTVTDSPLP